MLSADDAVAFGQDFSGVDLTKVRIDGRGYALGRSAARRSRVAAKDAAPAAGAGESGACGVSPRDATEAKLLALFEGRGRCDKHDPAAYARFLAEVPTDQHYAVNYIAWSTGRPLFPAGQAASMDEAMR